MKGIILLLSVALITFSTTFAQVRGLESIGINEISVIELANNGDIWVGSATEGVAFYLADSAKWLYYNTDNAQLHSNSITSIALMVTEGTPHTAIGTSDGGVITQPGTWDTIPVSPGTAIYGVGYRPDSMWVVTNNTIMHFDS